MKIKILLSFFLPFFSTIVFGQSVHCRTLAKGAVIGDELGMMNKSPYNQNTRAELIFRKKTFTHSGCNEAAYQSIVLENFDGDFDSTYWLKEYPYEPPFNKIHSFKNDNYLHEDDNTVIENGFLKLKVRKDNPTYTYIDKDGNSQTFNHEYSLGLLHSKNTYQGEWAVEAMGCFKYGRFSTRMKFPKSNDINAAFWFFGGGNEIDVFEIFHGTDGKIRNSVHQWNVITDDNGTHAEYGLDFKKGDLSNGFHTWEMEWTPFKITWSLDGKPFRTFYKYYRMSVTPQKLEKRICFIGLDCDEIPLGENTLYELSGWNTFSTYPIDLIIGLGITGKPKGNEEVLIDWVNIEQKPNMKLLTNNNSPCVGEEIMVEAIHTDQIVSWTVSDNLEIISIEENKILVRGNEDSSTAWVEAKTFGNKIDLPPNNWTTIGYTYNDPFDENSSRYHNFSYNCHETEMKVRKEINIGKPLAPILKNNVKPCLISGGFEISLENEQDYSNQVIFDWSSLSNASLEELDKKVWIKPDQSLENEFFEFQLNLENNCGTTSISENIFIPKCENNPNPPQLVIFPNPVNELLQIGLVKTNYEIILPSDSPFLIAQIASGKVFHQGDLGETTHLIDVKNWGQGTYVISYRLKGEKYHESFSIVR